MPRVLVVDDETDAVEPFREFLTAKGYEVLKLGAFDYIS
jgi:DNA-binding response OmpR family regulator